jgi:serine/threonine-protein kinase/endoribonuclease IRE1
MNFAQLSTALVGLHSIEGGRQQSFLTISSPAIEDIENDTQNVNVMPNTEETPTFIDRVRRLPSTATRSLLDFVNNPIMPIVILSLLLLYNKEVMRWLRSSYKTKIKLALEPPVVAEEVLNVATDEAAHPPIVTFDDTIVEVPTAQNDTLVAEPQEVQPLSRSRSNTEEGAPLTVDGAEDGPQPTPKKKKAHRGQRGGIKTLPTDVGDVSGPILRLGSLEVNTEKLIGTGSNGTMVFEGKFDGRDVAVKRMLIQFYDIASQETKLLRESDDHPNGRVCIAFLTTLLTSCSNPVFRPAAECRISVHCS